MQKQVRLPKGTIDPNTQAFNVPYSIYSQGSYFGDADCLREKPEENGETDEIKYYRDSTAVAEGGNADVQVLKKKHIEEVLPSFPKMCEYMRNIAREKHTYNKILIKTILKKYNDP
jgi:hypothetical protein